MRPNLTQMIESCGEEVFRRKINDLLDTKKLKAEDISYRALAEACANMQPLPNYRSLSESNPGIGSSLFQTITAELIARQVTAGFENAAGFIADQLVTVSPTKNAATKLVGMTALQGGLTVPEGQEYPESAWNEKSVGAKETKVGRILSISEELIWSDQTGEINRRAQGLGFFVRQTRERAIIRGITDADSADYAYRPIVAGVVTPTQLYKTNGSQYNWIGSGNTTSSSFNAAVPLVDYTDVDFARRYRATEVKDDRGDEGKRAIMMQAPVLLVPESLRATANRICNATEIRDIQSATTTVAANPHSEITPLSSPFIDEQGGQAVNDWYLGDPKKQFVWTEIWPVGVFVQDRNSPASFERDVAVRLKVRYWGGISATDTVWFTKIDGA